MRMRSFFAIILASTLTVFAPWAKAAYPERPITLIVAYGAGGSTDITARTLAGYIEKHLGNDARIVVMNRPGAGGEIGFSAVADAAADGYTLGFCNTPNAVTIPIERQARYSLGRLDPLAGLIRDPGVFAVHADSEIKTLADLIAFAKTQPRKVTVGTTGIGSDDHLAMLMVQRQANVVFTNVPFGSDAETSRSLLGRHIVVSAMNLSEVQRMSGDPLRVLGVMSSDRDAMAPTLPTFKEQGFDVVMSAGRGLVAPKGLPADIRAKLVDAITKAANDPEFQKKATETYQPVHFLDSEAYAADLTAADAQYRKLWQETPWFK